MKKIIISIVLSTLITAITILTLFEIQSQKAQLNADHTETINSEFLKQKRKLLVHLPKSYNENTAKKYPVIYALDATSHDRDVLNATSILSLSGHFPESIIVGIVNEKRHKDFTPPYILQNSSESGGADLFLRFLQHEAIPLITKNYRTNHYNMISGNSRAGLFAMYSLIENPDLFNAYFCYSPAFWRGNNIIAQKLNEFLATNSLKNFVYLSIGQNENNKMKNGFDKVMEVLKRNDSTPLQVHYDYTSSATHGTNAYYSIPKALAIWSEKH